MSTRQSSTFNCPAGPSKVQVKLPDRLRALPRVSPDRWGGVTAQRTGLNDRAGLFSTRVPIKDFAAKEFPASERIIAGLRGRR